MADEKLSNYAAIVTFPGLGVGIQFARRVKKLQLLPRQGLAVP
jgi:hypothetical protein